MMMTRGLADRALNVFEIILIKGPVTPMDDMPLGLPAAAAAAAMFLGRRDVFVGYRLLGRVRGQSIR